MSEFNPLVQRVDALLKRHQQQVAEVHEGQDARAGPDAHIEPEAEDVALPALSAQEHLPPAEAAPQPAAPAPFAADDGFPVLQDAVIQASIEQDDDDIPLLTEIVDPAIVAAKPAAFDQEAFAERIEAAVLDKLLAELDKTLDQRLGRTITDLLEQVLHGLRAELSVSVRQMVREAVSTAVSREMAERARRT